MMTLIAKADPESRVFKGYWQDGALDVAAGLALVTTGIFWLTGPAVGQSIAPVVAFAVYPILRKRVTEPRLGYVRFNAQRRSKLRLHQWLMIGVGLAAFVIGIGVYLVLRGGTGESSLASTLVPGLPAALVGLMSVGGAAILRLGRFLVYAAVLLCSGAAIVVVQVHPGWGLLAGGVVVTSTGLVVMLRFVREYPIASSEVD